MHIFDIKASFYEISASYLKVGIADQWDENPIRNQMWGLPSFLFSWFGLHKQ